MTLPEYIKQTRTTDLVNTVKHAALGLISEVGEVYGVLAKIERGDKIDQAERMTGELGDVAWYLARLWTLLEIPADRIRFTERKPIFSLHIYLQETQTTALGFAANGFVVECTRHQAALREWGAWTAACRVEGLDPLTVLESNLAKLRDRAARKVLQGDGDHR